MAPNLSESSSFHSLSSLASLNGLDLSSHVITSKYQPLVPPANGQSQEAIATTVPTVVPNFFFLSKDEQENTEQVDQDSIEQVDQSNDDHGMTSEEVESYWDVPSDEGAGYFSSAYIEENLTKDAQRRAREETKTNTATDNSEAYWDWTENTQERTKRALIETILKEEAIRQMLTGDNIVAQEAAYQKSKKEVKQCTGDNTRADCPSHDYFYFPNRGESKKAMIERILREEKQRQTLLTENIVKNLVRECEEKEERVEVRAGGRSCEESYWDW